KRAGRREYVRVKIGRAADGTVEAIKHAQEGAGIITSLTETDGLVELTEDITTVAPGATVGFLSYAALAAHRSDADLRGRSRHVHGCFHWVEDANRADRDGCRRNAGGDEGAHGQIPLARGAALN